MGVRVGDDRRGPTNSGAPARPCRRWRPAALAALAAVAILLASGAERDSHPPQQSETAVAIAAILGVEQVEPLGGKLHPPRYDTLDYELNQLVARHEGRDASPGTPAMVAGSFINVVVRLDPAYVHEVATYLREQGAGLAEPRPGAESLAAAVPLSALADLGARPGVHLVKAEPSIQRYGDGIAPHGADFWHDPGWQGGNGNDDDDSNDVANIRIGIIDTGFVGYSQAVTSGHVPTPKETLCYYRPVDPQNPQDPPTSAHTTTTSIDTCDSQTGWSEDSHGTWVTELVYDIAPGADYYLVRIDLASQFKDAITWLMAKDVEVISTSLGRTWEGPGDGTDPYADPENDRYTDAYPDSWLSQVNRAVDAGIFVAVAAGNAGASSWFGTFHDNDNDNVMEWDGARDECNEVRFASSTNYSIRLRWEDDWDGADDDLDIYLRQGTSNGTTAHMSEEVQNGQTGRDPIENIELETTSAVTYCLVIERAEGATTNWVQLVIESEGSDPAMEHLTEGYSITSPGETTKAGVLTVGAASVLTPSTIQSTSGRGPLPASSASTVVKPDIVGVDNIRLSTSGNSRATGTSLATPHIAGLAALVLHRNSGFTPAQIASYLRDNALRRGEPGPNNPWGYGLAFLPYIGPVITGEPRVGVTLTADISAIDDIDTLPTFPTFAYQWIRVSSGGTEANISDATSATYTLVQADVGSTLKVKVSFDDYNSNEEEQTSLASDQVVPLNRAATGKPTISGTLPLRVTETVTARTSAIRDSDGLSGVTFEYQWVLVDGGTDTDISGETMSSYVLRDADEGKKVKVKVSFTDNNGNAEMVVSDESAVVGSAPNRPAQFSAATTSREVEETAGEGENIGDPVDATDTESDPLAYSIKNDSGLFAIDPHSGQLRTNGALDYETRTSHTVVVQVTDNKDIDGMADPMIDDETRVTVNVLAVDEPPIITGLQTVDWLENAAGTIATYRASDPEGASVVLTLVPGGDANSFQLSNGRLSFLSTELPNFESRPSYFIELGAIDDPLDVDYDTRYAVLINILDVDEPADITFTSDIVNVFVDGNALSVHENRRGSLTIFTARDPENAPDLTYEWRLEGTDRGDFVIDGGRKLSFAARPDFERPADSNSDNTYNVTVAARGSDNKTGRIALTVTVLGVNERPVIKGPNMVTIEEGGATLVGAYTATDPEGASIVWQPLEGNDAAQFTFVPSTGRLALKNTPNYESPPHFIQDNIYNVTLAVRAGDDMRRRAVVVTVTNKDEPGDLGLSAQHPVVETELTATVSDLDRVDSTSLTVWTWERSTSRGGPWTALTGASSTATESTYTPLEADFDQYLRVTATYTDGHGMGKTLSDALEQRVVPQTAGEGNNQPEFTVKPQRRSVLESAGPNAPVGAAVTATDSDGHDLTYTLRYAGGYFTIDDHGSTAGQIRVAPGATLDREKVEEIVVIVDAADLTTASDTVVVTITIENVNDAPQGSPESVRTNEDEPIIIRVLDNDTDPENDELTVNIVSRPANGTVTVNPATLGASATVTYTPHLNYNGPDSFTYKAQDTGSPPLLSAETIVAVSVEPVNDAPTFLESMPTRLVPDNAKAGYIVGAPVTATDIVEGSMVSYGLSGEDAAPFRIDPRSGQITVREEVTFDITMKVTYTFMVTATDRSGASATVDVIITVEEANDPPEITLASAAGGAVTVSGSAVSVDENHTGDLVNVTATDPESTHTDYTLALGGTHSTSFTLNTGVLSFTNPPDHEVREVYDLTLTASNASESSTLAVTVTVRDVNDPPVISGETEVNLNEVVDPTPGQVVRVDTYTKSDPDRPLQTTNWGPLGSTTVLSGAHSDSFAFDQVTGRLTFASPPDYENGGGTYQVTLTANDGAAAGTLDVTVTVANVEETGTLTLGALQGVNGEALVATLTDPDVVATQTWVWQRRTGTSGAWTDIANTDASSYTPSADDVGNYLRASVTYTDGAGPNETTLTKATELPTLNDASTNQPPTPPDPLPQVAAVPEDAPAGRNVVQVVFTDPEGEQQLTYSLSGAAEFAIDSSTGRIFVSEEGGLNYEETTSYSVTVSAADSFGAAGMVMLTIGISDVDEPPEITLASAAGGAVTVDGNAVSVDENHAGDLVRVTATDPEGMHADYTLALGGTHSSSFTLNAGVLSFTSPPNHEAREVYRLTLTASNASESSTLDVTVTVRDVNDPPVISGETEVNLNEVVDPTPGQVVRVDTYTKSDPDRPLQTTNWGPVGSTTVLSGAHSDSFAFDQVTGRLTFASPPDYENGGGTYQVTLTANDGAAAGTLDVTVTVANVEETGTLTLGAQRGVNGEALVATLTDPDNVVSETWQWQHSMSRSGPWTDIANTDASSYTPTAADVGNYLRASVSYTDGAGPDETTLTADTEFPTDNDASGNEPPTPPDPLPQVAAVPEDAPAGRNVVQVVFTDPEGEQQLTYSLSGAAEFAIDSSTGRIFVSEEGGLNYEEAPSYLVTVRAEDSYGDAGTVTLTIRISDVPEPPKAADLAVTLPEDGDVAIDVVAMASDEDVGDILTLAAVVRHPQPGTVAVDDVTNEITYTPQANYSGADSFTYRVKDQGGLLSNLATVTITVAAVNDAPTFLAATATRTVSEGAREGEDVGAPFTATDIDEGDRLTYSLFGTDASLFEIDSNGQITVGTGITFAIQDTYSVTVTADDGSGETNATATVDVTIMVVTGPVVVVPPPSGGGGGGFGGGGGGGGGPSGPSPSTLDFEWTVKRDIEDLDGSHDTPSGLWSDGVTLWILENGQGADDAIYAYDLKSGERAGDREFPLADTNRAPRGIWSDRETVWVSDSGRERLFAYTLASGARDESREIELAPRNADARGIWSGAETVWVLDGSKNALFAYDLESGELLGEYALASTNGDPHGIWSDGTTVWVSDHGAKRLFAYRLPAPEGPAAEDAEPQDLDRVSDEEFGDLSKASNNSPRGIWSDGDVMYVADESDDRVYTYNMPDAIDARLASLSLSGVEIGKFDPGTTEYEGAPAEGVTETTVEASAVQRRTQVVTDPPDADADTAGHQVTLVGTGEITVTVTSADGTRTRVYRVAFETPPVELALTPTWTAIDWPGADGLAIAGAGLPDTVAAVYAWDEESRSWLAHFPGLADVPGLNTLTTLSTGATYWVAVSDPATWTVPALTTAADVE